jgi:hypothetical protein
MLWCLGTCSILKIISAKRFSNILSPVGVTYKTGFRLDDWTCCTLYIHTTRGYRQHSTIADLHTLLFTVTHALGFSVFTSRILATDLSQSHCNFKSHMKSFHSLIRFFSLAFGCFSRTRPNSLPSKLLFYSPSEIPRPFINPRHGTHGKHRLLLLRKRVYLSVT